MNTTKQALMNRFRQRDATLAVIGLGYVGLPLALAFARAGFEVIGIDVNEERVALLQQGVSYVEDIPHEHLRALLRQPVPAGGHASMPQRGGFQATTRFDVLRDVQAAIICVPTPLSKTGDPDISYITAAVEQVATYLHPGMLVVLESTTYPGTTTEVVVPALTAHVPTLQVGRDVFVCFSPERIDPGRKDWTIENTPKVMGGVTPDCLDVGRTLYEQAIQTIVPVSNTETAEMVKLLENTFRAVNIALVNEVLLMCDKLGLDAWEVIEAAATKPFGFMKFTPGPGLGGHCLPIDPLYLSWKLKTLNYHARFIDLATQINTSMPAYWVQKVQDALNDVAKPVRGSRILIIGVAYKRDVGDLRESPALDIIHLLQAKGAHVMYHDPHVPRVLYDGIDLTCEPDLDAALDAADCVVIVTDHSTYDWAMIRRRARVLIDTRHVA
ncbi:UDP-N-acetyl-D-glucosamine dehydrogenase [Ardenticatena maritima]|uniref:UDP-N-acetyl-D-glucosamine dehydrogenase n=1 Tax=Ardenticatena maritima TaxID=872965 RepID=A0A0N0RF90_9CHLR|nr:nucleotide sugar dehydrogenase [Ardenticatena maritima]KPL86384.1 UDP-N-acetyl-D-glucosamine dehydrogenase [Ardenticatena maritima]GAP61750.1 UDP-N-acetyl-D-glucosamine dehydrogenase [Ardenticatena maritima]